MKTKEMLGIHMKMITKNVLLRFHIEIRLNGTKCYDTRKTK